jgi:hypothetical protein
MDHSLTYIYIYKTDQHNSDLRFDWILKGSDIDVYHSGLLDFWTLFIVQYSKEHNIFEAVSVSILR